MLSEKLKKATKTNHQLLEKKLIYNIKSISTTKDYATLLGLFYSFFGGMEVKINEQIDAAQLPDYLQRRKATALADDLTQLGAALPVLATQTDVPEITNHLQALGALYVMEGSTLGGKIISKIIRQQLNQPDMNSMSFFNGYGEETDRMWETFKAIIDKPLSQPEQEIVVRAADETFVLFKRWFDRHL